MAKYLGPVCKLCRREGAKLFLKAERCNSPKCAFLKRGFAPGQHGRTKQGKADRESVYAAQLRAKQKARRIYGVFERQFRRYYTQALHKRGVTGFNLLQSLEVRLDNVIYRMGLAGSRAEARQLATHGHFVVNGHPSDIPSMLLNPGDVVSVRENSRQKKYFSEVVDIADKRLCAPWIERDLKNYSCRVLRLPYREEIDGTIQEQLIVEFYSR